MTTKLHEILAVEGTQEGYFKSIIPEQVNLFAKKPDHFAGFVKVLKLLGESTPDSEAREAAEKETKIIATTVVTELNYLQEKAGNYFDVIIQRDEANQRAVADIVIDGSIIAVAVPATTLLALENKLKQLRQVYDSIPTLQPGVAWELDPSQGSNIYKDVNPEIRAKTKKGFDHLVIVQATDKFPAQVKEWETTEDVGFTTKTRWSSMISVADKSELLGRFDKLLAAVKQARQRANEVHVTTDLTIGDALFNYLHSF